MYDTESKSKFAGSSEASGSAQTFNLKQVLKDLVNTAGSEDPLFAFHPKLYKCNCPGNILIRQRVDLKK